MDAEQVAVLRALLAPTGWLDRTSAFAHALRRSAVAPGGLLIVGTQDDEPWHMTAHLADESRLAGIPELIPTLIRWAPPPGGPAHLSIGLDRLAVATRMETLLVVSQQLAPEELLERVNDVRRAGATIFALDQGDPDLEGLAHEALPVSPGTAPLSFDAAQHLVSSAIGEDAGHPRRGGRHRPPGRASRRGSAAAPRLSRLVPPGNGRPDGQDSSLRGKLARLLDAVSGTQDD